MESGQPQPTQRIGMVLAGGCSSRMGRDKALLEVAGQTLLQRGVTLLASLGVARVVVSGDYPGFDCLPDHYPQLGPLAGLHAGCIAFGQRYQGMLVLPVDMPLMTAGPLRRLLELPTGGYYAGSLFPALVPLNSCLRQQLEARLDPPGQPGSRSVGRLFTDLDLPALTITPAERMLFTNSNTPDEWQACVNVFTRGRYGTRSQ